jgi:hypothetical protein
MTEKKSVEPDPLLQPRQAIQRRALLAHFERSTLQNLPTKSIAALSGCT